MWLDGNTVLTLFYMNRKSVETIERLLKNSRIEQSTLIIVEVPSPYTNIGWRDSPTNRTQAPSVTLFLYLDPENEYAEENAMIIEEILKQRLLGIKNEVGVYVTPAFPKLIYVLTPENNLSGGKYDYITELAIECTAKRMYPDYVSEKIMSQNQDGNVYSYMGCRSLLPVWKDENGKPKFEGRLTPTVGVA